MVLPDQLPHGGKHPDVVDPCQVEGHLAPGKGFHVDGHPVLLCQHGHYLAGGDAAVLVELCPIKRQAELGTGDFPGIQVQRHGVHQGAIHVEDQGVVLVESGLFTLVMIAGG